MSESRNELLAWFNDLSSQSYQKIEEFGRGAGLCIIFDSIFGDVPLGRVKMDAKSEWEFVANFKILQACFDKHKIDNYIPVERLIKCKFQDNLEFLQWVKKFWDQYYPGGSYEPKGLKSSKKANPVKLAPKPASKKKPGQSQVAVAAGPTSLHDLVDDYQSLSQTLTTQVEELKLTVEQVEKEREFYFQKLREIEVYIQGRGDVDEGMDKAFKDIQEIMYKTEEGFEAPAEVEAETF